MQADVRDGAKCNLIALEGYLLYSYFFRCQPTQFWINLISYLHFEIKLFVISFYCKFVENNDAVLAMEKLKKMVRK